MDYWNKILLIHLKIVSYLEHFYPSLQLPHFILRSRVSLNHSNNIYTLECLRLFQQRSYRNYTLQHCTYVFLRHWVYIVAFGNCSIGRYTKTAKTEAWETIISVSQKNNKSNTKTNKQYNRKLSSQFSLYFFFIFERAWASYLFFRSFSQIVKTT